jgi:N utilization substance protein A
MVMEPTSLDEVRTAQREGREPEMRPASGKGGYPLKQNANQILVAEAKKSNPNAVEGDTIAEDLPMKYFDGRVAAMAAKQVIIQKLKDVDRARELEQYKESVGKIVAGIVKRADHNGALIDLGRAEAFLPKDETIQKEMFKTNDRVRAYVYKIAPQFRGPQIFVSRTHPQFIVELFKEQVPEIANGTVSVKNVEPRPRKRPNGV